MGVYTVNLWGSDPGTNDDCYAGQDFESKDEALVAFNSPIKDPEGLPGYYSRDTAFIELDGPDLHLERANPDFRPTRDDEDWKRERAMEAAMAFGCDGWNDFYG